MLEYAPAVTIGIGFAFNNYNRNTLTRRVVLKVDYQIRSKNILMLQSAVTKYNLHCMFSAGICLETGTISFIYSSDLMR